MANLKSVLKSLPLAILILGCAKARPVQHVLALPERVEKTALDGTFVFLKSVVEVKSPGAEYRGYAVGQHLESDRLVRFALRENRLDVVSIDPLYETESRAPSKQVLASFPSKMVDLVRKKTPDGDETHEEVESDEERTWEQRDYVRLNLLEDPLDPLQAQTSTSTIAFPLELDATRGALNFVVQRDLHDGTSLSIRYSFLRFHPSRTYRQRPYPLSEQVQFGFFQTTTFSLDAFDQFTERTRERFLNRWDTTKAIVFHFAPDFPEHLKPAVRKAHREWADALKVAVGDAVLPPIQENTGQQLGDLRYNLVVYDGSDHTAHGILGYAPLVTNPRSGEILKADVVLYGRVLKRSVFQEVFWQQSRRIPVEEEAGAVPIPLREPVALLQRQTQSDLGARITRLNEAVVERALAASRSSVDPIELENQVFKGIFQHEFGHVLGLRHNFRGSREHDEDAQGSPGSMMSYAFLETAQPHLGDYDRSALIYAYSPDDELRAKQLQEGFGYCTDEDIYSSRSPLCQLTRSSQSLSDLVDRQIDRYRSLYEVNNRRLERLEFGEDGPAYERRILSLLLPLRQVYDNAHALLQAASAANYSEVWALARQRVEASASSRKSGVLVARVESGTQVTIGSDGPRSTPVYMDRNIDLDKVAMVVRDAKQAKNAAVDALRRVILDRSRPDYDVTDSVQNKIQLRGILRDKLLALSLIVSPTDHPIARGKIVSPYSLSERVVPNLFASLLSNTSEVEDPEGSTEPYFRIQQYDMNLRKHALRLLTDEVAQVGRHPEARELLRIQTIDKVKSPAWEKYNSARAEFQEFYRTLITGEVVRGGDEPLSDSEFSFADLSAFEQPRNQFESGYTSLEGNRVLAADVNTDVLGIKTATGLLIRNNLNVAEDFYQAIDKTRTQLQEEVFRDGINLASVQAIALLDRKRHALRRYITGEQLFLREMYRSYTGEK